MTEPDFDAVRAVFIAARDLDHDERAALLRAEDTALRVEVESLLAHHDENHDAPALTVVPKAIDAFFEPTNGAGPLPRRFGEFELLELIGQGGMGTVYRARQRTPDRTVAVKVIRPGMFSATMLRRFRYEADMLARLEHPGIARIYEAGTISTGGTQQPYVALELVAGQPIDEFVRTHQLDVRARIGLLIDVCDAVHHAHLKGVIHRDLKPANILVDADGQPRILDFGVARATDAGVTMQTDPGQLVGTLPYMSPEQVSGDPRHLDVRSDVYALGVLIFELLSGRLPHDLTGLALAEAALLIRDAAPPRLGALDDALRGDLETIAGTALEKHPARRYQSAATLAEDLRRFLAHQPIIARPPSVVHQLRLFARRQQALVAVTALGLCALVLATVISVAFAVQAHRAAGREARQGLIAERTNVYLKRLVMFSDPHQDGGVPSMDDALDRIIAELDAESELPEVEASLRTTIGETHLNLGDAHRSQVQLERAVALWRAIDPQSVELGRALVPLGTVRRQLGTPSRSESALREAIAILDAHGGEGLLRAQAELVSTLLARRSFRDAEPIARALLARARADGNLLMQTSWLRKLGRIESGVGAFEASLEHMEEALTIGRDHLPAMHPVISGVLVDLVMARKARGDLEGALEASRDAWTLATNARTPGSPDWMTCINVHTQLLAQLDQPEHRRELEETLIMGRLALEAAEGSDHRLVGDLRGTLIKVYEHWGDVEKARALRDEAAETAPTSSPTSGPSSGPTSGPTSGNQ